MTNRDLDELIARKIMDLNEVNWYIEIPYKGWSPCSRLPYTTEYATDRIKLGYRSSEGDVVEIPHYTANLGDSWKLLEKIVSDGRFFALVYTPETKYYELEIEKFGTIETVVESGKNVISLICRASLRAYGVELPAETEESK